MYPWALLSARCRESNTVTKQYLLWGIPHSSIFKLTLFFFHNILAVARVISQRKQSNNIAGCWFFFPLFLQSAAIPALPANKIQRKMVKKKKKKCKLFFNIQCFCSPESCLFNKLHAVMLSGLLSVQPPRGSGEPHGLGTLLQLSAVTALSRC